jgi:hypothetical protein
MTTKTTKQIGLGRSKAVKTFTRINNNAIQARKRPASRHAKVTTQQSCVAYIKAPLFPAYTLAVLVVILFFFSSAWTVAANAETLSPWFHVTSVSRPGNLHGETGEIVVTAVNVGDASANATVVPLTLTDVLPPRLKARFIEQGTENYSQHPPLAPGKCELTTLTCTFATGDLPPFNQIEILIGVKVEVGASTGEVNEASISGGGAPLAAVRHPITVSAAPTPFGVEDFEGTLEEVGGAADTQAGSHPFQFTTTFDLNEGLELYVDSGTDLPVPAALAKDVVVKLPPGLIGNPTAYPRCPLAQFSAAVGNYATIVLPIPPSVSRPSPFTSPTTGME